MTTATPSHLVTSLLSSPSLSPPLSDSALHSLALLLGPNLLLDALDLIDRDQLSRLTPPSATALYQVSSSSHSSYTVYPHAHLSSNAAVGGAYCPCPAFSRAMFAPRGAPVICKHLLAVLLSLRLSSPLPAPPTPNPLPLTANLMPPPPPPAVAQSQSAFVEKKVTLDWVAGLATRFGAAGAVSSRDGRDGAG
ncbi:hypothetical protein JCM11641_002177 [Rhodosporidiobolus odoratus]